MANQGFGIEVLFTIDAQQHHDKEDQHDDGAGVDDDLHNGEQLGAKVQEKHSDPEQRRNKAECSMHRVTRGNDPESSGKHDECTHDKDRSFHDQRSPPRSSS